MRKILTLLFIILLLPLCFSSCIEDYELPPSETESMVVIDGQIVSERTCVFTLSTTISTTGERDKEKYIGGAKVVVKGTDGQEFKGYEIIQDPGRYSVYVGKLDANAKYYVAVSTKYGDFESEPMSPIDAPELTEAFYDQPREDRKVDVMISTEDTHSPEYVMWNVEEYWEIYTPYVATWEYVEGYFDKLTKKPYREVPVARRTNHGWRHAVGKSGIASNEAYAFGAIKGMCIYQLERSATRLQTRYCARIRLTSLCKEEYEYRILLDKLTHNTGGVFSYMPSELPSNIKSLGKTKGLGFVGVQGKGSTKDLYINGKDVEYLDQEETIVLGGEEIKAPHIMASMGYVLLEYGPPVNNRQEEEYWTYPWCVDYRHYYWGGETVYEKPDFWVDE